MFFFMSFKENLTETFLNKYVKRFPNSKETFIKNKNRKKRQRELKDVLDSDMDTNELTFQQLNVQVRSS